MVDVNMYNVLCLWKHFARTYPRDEPGISVSPKTVGLIYFHWLFPLPAVNEQSMPLPAKNRHKLIHNATGYTSMSVFSLLTCYCFEHLVSIIWKIKKDVELIPKLQLAFWASATAERQAVIKQDQSVWTLIHQFADPIWAFPWKSLDIFSLDIRVTLVWL